MGLGTTRADVNPYIDQPSALVLAYMDLDFFIAVLPDSRDEFIHDLIPGSKCQGYAGIRYLNE